MISELQAAIEEIQKYAKEYLDEYLDAVRDELQAALARAEEAERQRDEAWTAGAEAMREACEDVASKNAASDDDACKIAEAIRALPIPAQEK